MGRPHHGLGDARRGGEGAAVPLHRRAADAHDARAVARHLEEYLDDVRDRLPSAARFGLAVATPTSLGRRGLAAIARRNAMTHAQRFIAGTDAKEVLAAALQRTAAEAGLHDRRARRSRHQRRGSRSLGSGSILDLIENLGPTVNAWPEVPQIDRDQHGQLPRRECVDQAFGAR